MNRRTLVLVALLSACSFGGAPRGDAGAEAQDGGALVDGGSLSHDGGAPFDGGSTDGGLHDGGTPDGGGDAGCTTGPVLHTCQTKCQSPSDCTTVTEGAYAAANYACDAGVCQYLGCRSDDECAISFASTGHAYRCITSACIALHYCAQACGTAADCATEAANVAGAYGDDNYHCDHGICVYTGCRSDTECANSYAATGKAFVCRDSFCQFACDSPSDCATTSGGAYDAAHYACEANGCRWLGCDTDQSCRDALSSEKYVCR